MEKVLGKIKKSECIMCGLEYKLTQEKIDPFMDCKVCKGGAVIKKYAENIV